MSHIEFLSGWLGGALGILSTHPIDTVRVRMQIASRSAPNTTYWMIVQQMRAYHHVGIIQTAFRGFLPPVLFRGFSMGLNRTGYNAMADYYAARGQSQLKGISLAITGSVSGCCQAFGDHPLYLVKCRAQTTKTVEFQETLRTYYQMAREICKSEGIRGWTRGFIPGLLCAVTTYPIFYLMYDRLRCLEWNPMTAGAVAAISSWPIGLPFDTMRVRMQLAENRPSFLSIAAQLMRQPVRQWFVGMSATIFRAGPRYAICMWSMEQSTSFLSKHL